ncbi:uncharacterized protein [Miscanthus floridulus]|uniref:uncharacterized protein n=1 Tax=Miscanthus floridulus TaxID=154761 RepID=UPI00345884FB
MVRLRAGESFPAREEPRRVLVIVGRKKATTPTSIRAGAGVRNKSKGPTSPDAAMPPPSRMRPERAAAAAGDVTVEDTDALDCGVCFLPLKPPIFQCKAGHAVCSVCRDKLKATGNGKCHVCGVATGGYTRCHAMEHLVESIRFPCPNAIHGCTVRSTYYDQHCHRLHTPCHCSGKACGFVGSTATLLDHFARAHDWPCATKVRAATTTDYGDDDDCEFTVSLRYGFNFLVADCDTADGTTDDGLYLFLLNVAQKPLGCNISVFCIHPQHGQAPPREMQCELSYSWHVPVKSRRGGEKLIKHYQESTFTVGCTDLSSGPPEPDECFQFKVSESVLAGGDKIRVGGRIVIC